MKDDRPSSMPDPRPTAYAVAQDASERTGEIGREVRSEALLLGRTSVTIAHEGMHYVLRATRAGKLILTK